MPVGTARLLRARARAAALACGEVDLAWNPEFLREGYAVRDSLAPDRIVFGVTSDEADQALRLVYATPLAAGVPALTMDLEYRRARQGGGQLVPRDEDLLHQRDG